MKIILSIVSITKNNAHGLARTLSSIRWQTARGCEVIVVDGQSTDETFDVLKNYQAIVDKVICESTPGVYGAMNDGIGLARGEWVMFLNAGDEFAHERVIEGVDWDSEADVIFGDAKRKGNGELANPWEDGKSFSRGMPICHQTIFFRRRVLDVQRYDLRFVVAGDYELLMRLKSLGCKIERQDILVAIYEGGRVSFSNRRRYRRMFENAWVVWKYDPNWSSFGYFLGLWARFFARDVLCILRGRSPWDVRGKTNHGRGE